MGDTTFKRLQERGPRRGGQASAGAPPGFPAAEMDKKREPGVCLQMVAGFNGGGGKFFLQLMKKMQNTLGTLRLLEGPRTQHGGGRAKMPEATQTTFFRDFFGKEMSEN